MNLRHSFQRANLSNIHNVRNTSFPTGHGFVEGTFADLLLVSNNYYGTTVAAVEAVAKTGKKCILDIEMEVGVPLPLCLCEKRSVDLYRE